MSPDLKLDDINKNIQFKSRKSFNSKHSRRNHESPVDHLFPKGEAKSTDILDVMLSKMNTPSPDKGHTYDQGPQSNVQLNINLPV